MEYTQVEVVAVSQVMSDQAEADVRELVELELALVGGGQGEIILG